MGTRKRENLYIRLLMGDLTIKFTRHIRNSPIFVMTRICPNDVAADRCSQPCFDLFKGDETPIGGRSATCEVVGWVRFPGLYRNQGIGRSRQVKIGAHGPNDRTSHTIGREDVWLVTSDVVWSNERSNCYISHKLKSAQTPFTIINRDGLLLILASSRPILGTSDSCGGEETFTDRKIFRREQFSIAVLEAEADDSDVMRLQQKI